MSQNTIRLLVVASTPTGRDAIQNFQDPIKDRLSKEGTTLEIVAVAYNKRAAIQQFKNQKPDLVLIDLMLPSMRSIEIISFINGTSPDTRMLALTPGDPPHEQIILALQAGVLGYVSHDAPHDEIQVAIQEVIEGRTHLPKDDTYEILQLAANDLIVSKKEKRAQFFSGLIGLVPAVGILAAFTSFLWREYWGQIGVRVSDLGVDSSKRVVELLICLLLLLGALGPLLFINTWLDKLEVYLDKIRDWIPKEKLRADVDKALNQRWVIWCIFALIILTLTLPLNFTGGKILTILLGVVFGGALLGNLAGLGHSLPSFFVLSRERVHWAMGITGTLLVVLMLALSVEVFLRGPDLRHDGLHGSLVRKALDISARPAMFHDLDGNHPPLGALYLGGNADLYVLYDPNTKNVRMIPVGSTRVELVDKVPKTNEYRQKYEQ